MSAAIYPAARLCADFISRALSDSQTSSRPLFVGFQGPQGCGKTTLTSQTKTILQELPNPIHAVVFSIDDLYLPYSGLTQLAQTHPDNALLNGRGQPGTHDPKLGSDLLSQLARINEGGEVRLPAFDKSAYGGYGDRSEEAVVIVPENLHYVFEWRLQQEHAMKLKNGGRGMTDEQVHNFVARYMPGYELFQDTIELPSNPWHGHDIKIKLDRQRTVVRTEQF
ncbi:hypothetical protein FRC09_001291 [Ceratobasidium sp. 395]|nr:hypothetical protein FRC09_001291 [Ceratobasidium sp. 395]